MIPRFDPTRAIIYDFARGQLKDDEERPRLNLPCDLLLRLCHDAGEEAAVNFASELGTEMGRRILDKMGPDAEAASLEQWVEHLGGQLALLGLGNLALERWGKALVLRVQEHPPGAAGLAAHVLMSALQRGLSRDVGFVPFAEETATAFLVLSPDSAEKAQEWALEGSTMSQVIENLHQGAA
ncbi:MAG: hypothetical protein MK135_03510 [Polyangiaceae bacterium]|nr:hypothetical protein [Polyangiaceae bacterium]